VPLEFVVPVDVPAARTSASAAFTSFFAALTWVSAAV
jgi:hypothetical protein